MATATQEAPVALAAFGVEANTHNNGDIKLQCIAGCRLRGRIEPGKSIIDAKTGDELIPDSRQKMAKLGRVPGMELHVNPAKLTYTIRDPLHGDDDLCDKITRRIDDLLGGGGPEKLRGNPPLSGDLDIDMMKTLCRELRCLVDSGDMALIRGTVPSTEEIENSPGRFLHNAGMTTFTSHPRYEEDWDAWVQQLARMG